MSREPAETMDDIDLNIVEILMKNSRASVRAIAEQIHVSRSQTYARLERLEERGVLQRFTVVVPPEKLGFMSSALVAITVKQDSHGEITDVLRTLPYVHDLYLLAGTFELLVLIRAPNQQIMSQVILRELGQIEGVLSTKTWMIFAEEHFERLPERS